VTFQNAFEQNDDASWMIGSEILIFIYLDQTQTYIEKSTT